ncbi:MAG: N-acetylmuramoyl-L-alanine amidase [Cetobacterium sp.]|uniref:N-acetylmuramoyl-L-alanine amidase n=1 Tax=Cetobacterium sp. TaxID=2071632 RepID=UPI003F3E3D9D
MNVCLIVGHNRKSSGAYDKVLGMSENKFARLVCAHLLESGIDVDVLTRRYVEGRGYTSEMAEEVALINAGSYDLCIEIHFNASEDPKSRGCEVLAFHKSEKGKQYGRLFCKYLNELTGIPIRRGDGILEITSTKQNGGYGIINSKPCYILIESHFSTNEADSNLINPYVVGEVIGRIINGK